MLFLDVFSYEIYISMMQCMNDNKRRKVIFKTFFSYTFMKYQMSMINRK